ncbi:hypothetical protein LSH36_471g03040 [Paralvinella palmiformis]|uniref:Uncharacterized protein n=1 Tax=Paralvinella palmiformis TaxID=53620 RepID=A0AAD9JA18_9ANNE|nr:hypothetical protein LSH36_471g03040 [Paralvinella palmiformis]
MDGERHLIFATDPTVQCQNVMTSKMPYDTMPEVDLKGCTFHFAQALFRKVQFKRLVFNQPIRPTMGHSNY